MGINMSKMTLGRNAVSKKRMVSVPVTFSLYVDDIEFIVARYLRNHTKPLTQASLEALIERYLKDNGNNFDPEDFGCTDSADEARIVARPIVKKLLPDLYQD